MDQLISIYVIGAVIWGSFCMLSVTVLDRDLDVGKAVISTILWPGALLGTLIGTIRDHSR